MGAGAGSRISNGKVLAGMIIIDSNHAGRLEGALHMAGAIRDNGTVNTDFGASIYILTGLPSVYDRVQQYIHNGWLDFGPMLRMALSGGEKILVELAGNLYNGSFFIGYTPEDIVSQCDSNRPQRTPDHAHGQDERHQPGG